MKLRWLIWLGVTVLWFLYLGAGFLAGRVESTTVILRPGSTADLSFFRLVGDQPVMWLDFKRQPGQMRPELGDYTVRRDPEPGHVEYPRPGPQVKISISSADSETVVYEAMPPAKFSNDAIGRALTSNLSVAPGVWRTQRNYGPQLRWGINRLMIKVVSMGPELSNEMVKLVLDPALSLKWCHPSVCWLGWGLLLWPIILAVQLIWLIVLGILALRRGKRVTR